MKPDATHQPLGLILLESLLLMTFFVIRHQLAPWTAESVGPSGAPLAELLTRFSRSAPGWSQTIAYAIALWSALATTRLAIRYTIVPTRNYLPTIIYLLTACGLLFPEQSLVAFIGGWLLILSTKHFIASFHKDYRFDNVFRGSFYLGLLPLLYAPALLLMLLAPGLWILYRRSPRECIIGLAGLLLPLFTAAYIYWAMGYPFSYPFWLLFTEAQGYDYMFWASFQPATLATTALLSLAVVAAIGYILSLRHSYRTRLRKIMVHLLLLLFVLSLSAAAGGSSPLLFPLLALPLTLLTARAFTGRSIRTASVAYWMILAVILASNLSSLL